MARKRINKSRQYELSDARLGFSNFYCLYIFATGRQVLVSANSPEGAVVALQRWLRVRGLDSRVLIVSTFISSDVLSTSSLLHQAELMSNDPKLFV